MYEIRCWAGYYNNDWLVLKGRNIMTQGSVIQCLRWVNVWGNVLTDKKGQPLSDKLNV